MTSVLLLRFLRVLLCSRSSRLLLRLGVLGVDVVQSAIRSSAVRQRSFDCFAMRSGLNFVRAMSPRHNQSRSRTSTNGSSSVFAMNTTSVLLPAREPSGRHGASPYLAGAVASDRRPLLQGVASLRAAWALCHILTPNRRMAATTAIFLCLGFRFTSRW